jgi:hypothetical protein
MIWGEYASTLPSSCNKTGAVPPGLPRLLRLPQRLRAGLFKFRP